MNFEDYSLKTQKKNQHYIPKFYLRNFSYLQNGKQIGLFNLISGKYFPTGKLKTQGSKPFFYGYDGVIEEALSKIEDKISKTIQDIIKTQSLPQKNSLDQENLLMFVALTHLRNPVIINSITEQSKHFEKLINESQPDSAKKFATPEITHRNAIDMVLSILPNTIERLKDLEYKILINETSTSFITSDFPVALYNQFLESKKWKHGKTGFANVGLQIFIPLNPKITLTLFDSGIYKIGEKKKHKIVIRVVNDILQLNALQLLNCHESIFFNENISENYIRTLISRTNGYNKPNQVKSSLNFINTESDPNPEYKNLMIMGSTDLEIKLKISGINLNSKSKAYKFSRSVEQIRPQSYKNI
ncbi:MAG TPA: DUF4238 domain-containing protein [Leadbetterella sp.]|nr:DUF4238 domain-containing protein [Leadbetterella sp.]